MKFWKWMQDWIRLKRTYYLTNAQVMEYLWRIRHNQELKEIERNRKRLSWRRLVFYGQGVVLPFNRKERKKQEVKPIRKRAGQGCA